MEPENKQSFIYVSLQGTYTECSHILVYVYGIFVCEEFYICSFTDRKQKIKIYRGEKDERNRLCKRRELYI